MQKSIGTQRLIIAEEQVWILYMVVPQIIDFEFIESKIVDGCFIEF